MLVDEGRMAWDDPVRKHLDYFHLADPLADGAVTVRDLLTHRTGLGTMISCGWKRRGAWRNRSAGSVR
jgi:CubicO group peptidase (beta-lactamase class C family)